MRSLTSLIVSIAVIGVPWIAYGLLWEGIPLLLVPPVMLILARISKASLHWISLGLILAICLGGIVALGEDDSAFAGLWLFPTLLAAVVVAIVATVLDRSQRESKPISG